MNTQQDLLRNVCALQAQILRAVSPDAHTPELLDVYDVQPDNAPAEVRDAYHALKASLRGALDALEAMRSYYYGEVYPPAPYPLELEVPAEINKD